ncbi:uncharacterized protein [Glycine max]|uniref:uncharacterized protein n=1 Tax=Glycine max TaxID=3847 RepID=UPI0003DE82E7|nr:uncharacterized protein LOC100816966 [Glycine max]|eukprot:XP_006605191.1 uncharacterized protein LOC100816966 [Glycine max]
MCQALWGDSNVSWEFQLAINTAGRLLCIWNDLAFKVERSIKGRGFILLEGVWTQENKKTAIIDIYSPCDSHNKRELWESLKQLRRITNAVKGVLINGSWVDDPTTVKEEICRFFKNRFAEPEQLRPVLNGTRFNGLGQQQNELLFWEVLKPDISRFITEFHVNGVFLRGTNTSFIALIPKVKDPRHLNDGRQLLHSALIANEAVEEAKRCNKSCLVFKVDYERAYDFVSWNFLSYMMKRLGFCPKWITWIEGCLKSASVPVLVNGSPTNEFIPHRVVRQGDPLTPLLFNIVAEGLTGLMREALDRNLYTSLLVGKNKIPVNILQYADDTIFFGEATMQNVKTIKSILRSFELASGLKINFAKSSFGAIGKSDQWRKEAAEYLNCRILPLPFMYLGIPIGDNPRRSEFWDPILRKYKGGLGIKDLRTFNSTLLGKWRWELFHNQEELWAKVICSKYGGWRAVENGIAGSHDSIWWKDLISVHKQQQNRAILRETSWKVGGGQKFRFWEDPWTADEVPLMVKFPRLYQISRQQNQLINQVGSVTNQGWEWKFNWRRSLFDSEVEMADTFLGEIPQQLLEFHKEDTWICKFDSSGYYSTSSGYKLIWGEIMGAHQNSEFSKLWKLKIPAKAAVFAWRLIRNRLPTKKNLSRRQVQVNDILCPFCRNKEEDAAHLFFTCNSILPLWWESMSWVNLSSAMPQHPRDHYLQHGHNAAEGKKSTRWKCWWIALTFTIWKHKNKIVFQSVIFDGSKLLDDAVLLIWSWIKTMEKDFVMHFNHWSSNLKEGFSS